MKKIIFALIVCALGVACEQKKNSEKPASFTKHHGDTAKALYGFAIDSVCKDTARFGKHAREAFKGVDPVKGFTVRAIDLYEAMGMNVDRKGLDSARFSHVRFYLGLDSMQHFKLFLTPVVGAELDANPPNAGRDSILYGPFARPWLAPNDTIHRGGYMLDFSSPCPPTCPDLKKHL